jgi:hypothetical protein
MFKKFLQKKKAICTWEYATYILNKGRKFQIKSELYIPSVVTTKGQADKRGDPANFIGSYA